MFVRIKKAVLNERIKVPEYKGKLVVIEGADGCGKTLATDLLVRRLRNCGFSVTQRDFPNYGKPPTGNPASYFIRKYLCKHEFGFQNGYGPSVSVDPRVASQFYALERYDAAYSQEPGDKPNLLDNLTSGYIVISNRYVESNLGHQGAKIKDPVARGDFMRWVVDLEYNFYKIPRPDLVILLDIDPDLAIKAKREQRENQGLKKDGHEIDEDFIRASREAYLDAAELFKDNWEVVKVSFDSGVKVDFRETKDIQLDIWPCLTKHNVIR